jgi:histidinol-phosphatase (PHP family)
MHTPLCRHATGEPEEFAQTAVRVGLTEIGFSDHNPMRRDDFDDWRMRLSDLSQYIEKIERTRKKFPQLTIKLALEVDYVPGYEDWVRDLASRYPWDYLIGSVHYISEEWAIDNPQQLSQWKRHEPLRVWETYAQRLTMAAASGLFDIIGHADLCKKFCIYPDKDPSALFRSFLDAAKLSGTAIEINTAGLRKDCREIYPSPGILKIACELGVPITFGSDAHAPGEVGMNFNEALELARDAGYRKYCRFTRRQAESVSL